MSKLSIIISLCIKVEVLLHGSFFYFQGKIKGKGGGGLGMMPCEFNGNCERIDSLMESGEKGWVFREKEVSRRHARMKETMVVFMMKIEDYDYD